MHQRTFGTECSSTEVCSTRLWSSRWESSRARRWSPPFTLPRRLWLLPAQGGFAPLDSHVLLRHQFFTTNFTLHSASTRPPSDRSPLDCSLPSLTSGRWWPRWPSTTPCISWATRTLPSLPWVLLLLMVRSKYTIYCINTLLPFYWFITGACCRFTTSLKVLGQLSLRWDLALNVKNVAA